MTKKKDAIKEDVLKPFVAKVTMKVGTNPDGSAKLDFKQGEPILLTKQQEINSRKNNFI